GRTRGQLPGHAAGLSGGLGGGGLAAVRPGAPAGAEAAAPAVHPPAPDRRRRLRPHRRVGGPARLQERLLRPHGPRGALADLPPGRPVRDAAGDVHGAHSCWQHHLERRLPDHRPRPGIELDDDRALHRRAVLRGVRAACAAGDLDPDPLDPPRASPPPARWASAPIRSRGPTTPDWTPSCWPAGTGATWSITTATGAGRRSSRISMPAGTRCTWPSRTWSTMPISARWCARPMPSRWGPSTSSADVAGTGAERWSPTATSTRSTILTPST